MGSALRLIALCGLMGCFRNGACQSGTADPDLYESFFRQVARFTIAPESGLLNGQAAKLRQTTLAEATGLTDAEARVLNAIASECGKRIQQFDVESEPEILDARLRIIAAEKTDASKAALRLSELAKERAGIVLAQRERLQAALGDSRFTTLDAWIHGRKDAESLFSPLR
jgi:hypothetical protein